MGTKRKVKFLLVTGIYPPDIGGPATYIPHLENYLQRNGISHSTITLAAPQFLKNEITPEALTRIKRSGANPRRFWKVMNEVVKQGRDAKFIFANGLHEEVGVALLFMRKKKAIAKIVGDPVWERAKNSGKTSLSLQEFNTQNKFELSLFLQRKLLKFSLNRFDTITCPSEELVQLVEKWGVRIPVVLIQNGVAIHPYRRDSTSWDIVSISRLVKWKNTEKLIEFAISGGFSLAIIGSGPEENRLRKLAAGNSRIVFLGELDKAEIFRELSKSRFFGLFSDYEGLSFSLLESMSFGVIPIVNANQGNLDVVSDGLNGFVISIAEIDSSAQKVLKLSANQSQLNSISRAAYRTCEERFDIEKKIDELMKLYLDEI